MCLYLQGIAKRSAFGTLISPLATVYFTIKLQIHNKDIHKFLFELWNTREIGIVINLYKEMETKQKGYERDNIYSNIMSYCSMKENKLYQYIESNSSIL